jgi:16S rRNA U516 pseudouridylate synthase RsuA-like enzyme
MCTSAGLELKNLRRIQVGEIKLGKLQQGRWRFLNETEMGYLDSL